MSSLLLCKHVVTVSSLLCKGVVVVHDVYDNGAAAKDARLLPGDLILEVIISGVCFLSKTFLHIRIA